MAKRGGSPISTPAETLKKTTIQKKKQTNKQNTNKKKTHKKKHTKKKNKQTPPPQKKKKKKKNFIAPVSKHRLTKLPGLQPPAERSKRRPARFATVRRWWIRFFSRFCLGFFWFSREVLRVLTGFLGVSKGFNLVLRTSGDFLSLGPLFSGPFGDYFLFFLGFLSKSKLRGNIYIYPKTRFFNRKNRKNIQKLSEIEEIQKFRPQGDDYGLDWISYHVSFVFFCASGCCQSSV